METNEIMVNEEVIEITEEIVKVSSGKGFKAAAGIGLAVIAGVIAYKYVAIPILAKIKARKEQQTVSADSEIIDCDESSVKDVTEENED